MAEDARLEPGTEPAEAGPEAEAEEARKARAARAVGALGAAGIGYWLGKELFEDGAVELDEKQQLVYFQGEKGTGPDLWLGATDVSSGDRVRVSGQVKEVTLHPLKAWRQLGLEKPVKRPFTSVVVQAGGHELPFFFAGDLRKRFTKGEPTTIYTGVLGKDVHGRPSERLALGQRGGPQLLTAENLEAPIQWEPMVMAMGMGLAVLKSGSKKK